MRIGKVGIIALVAMLVLAGQLFAMAEFSSDSRSSSGSFLLVFSADTCRTLDVVPVSDDVRGGKRVVADINCASVEKGISQVDIAWTDLKSEDGKVVSYTITAEDFDNANGTGSVTKGEGNSIVVRYNKANDNGSEYSVARLYSNIDKSAAQVEAGSFTSTISVISSGV